MAQDNEVKKPAMMATPENTAGNESGVSTTAGYGTTATQNGTAFSPETYLNIDASSENKAAKFKYPNVSQDVPEAGRNQYQ